MSKNIDILITCCKDCPYCRWYELFSYYKCGHEEVKGIIENVTTTRDDCPLKDAGVRVGCTILIFRDGKVLLGERGESCETIPGVYAFPGGRMDYGEITPEQSVIRELFEETGLVITEGVLGFLRYCNEYFPEANKHYISLVFIACCPEGEPEVKEPDKCKGWEWFDPEHLPENIFGPTKESILISKRYIATI